MSRQSDIRAFLRPTESLWREPEPVESIGLDGVEGLILILNAITRRDEEYMRVKIYEQTWSCDLSRRTQQFGFHYDYWQRLVSASDRELPTWSEIALISLENLGVYRENEKPNQLIVNEYEPGQGIAPHIDHRAFGEPIVSLSLCAPIVMDFERDGFAKRSLLLPRRSALVLDGDARWLWRHGIAARRSDVVDGRERMRETRLSVTLRRAVL